jgi:hypothetical protein
MIAQPLRQQPSFFVAIKVEVELTILNFSVTSKSLASNLPAEMFFADWPKIGSPISS